MGVEYVWWIITHLSGAQWYLQPYLYFVDVVRKFLKKLNKDLQENSASSCLWWNIVWPKKLVHNFKSVFGANFFMNMNLKQELSSAWRIAPTQNVKQIIE